MLNFIFPCNSQKVFFIKIPNAFSMINHLLLCLVLYTFSRIMCFPCLSNVINHDNMGYHLYPLMGKVKHPFEYIFKCRKDHFVVPNCKAQTSSRPYNHLHYYEVDKISNFFFLSLTIA